MGASRSKTSLYSKTCNTLWDAWCIASIIGIWPRYIEPRLIGTTSLTIKVQQSGKNRDPIKIAHITDLHLNTHRSDHFLDRLLKKIHAFQPDTIAFTGDFLCHAQLPNQARLKKFIDSLRAPAGSYAVLGNHDHSKYISIGPNGDYDVTRPGAGGIISGLCRLIARPRVTGYVTPAARSITIHPELAEILADSPITLLNNESLVIEHGLKRFNVAGLGDHMTGQCLPEKTFTTYDHQYPGVVLSHNPDTIPKLINYPGDIILCGHSHGGAVNLPFIWKRVTVLENMDLVRGYYHRGNKFAYVNRGLGGTIPFRWCSRPELLLLTLQPE